MRRKLPVTATRSVRLHLEWLEDRRLLAGGFGAQPVLGNPDTSPLESSSQSTPIQTATFETTSPEVSGSASVGAADAEPISKSSTVSEPAPVEEDTSTEQTLGTQTAPAESEPVPVLAVHDTSMKAENNASEPATSEPEVNVTEAQVVDDGGGSQTTPPVSYEGPLSSGRAPVPPAEMPNGETSPNVETSEGDTRPVESTPAIVGTAGAGFEQEASATPTMDAGALAGPQGADNDSTLTADQSASARPSNTDGAAQAMPAASSQRSVLETRDRSGRTAGDSELVAANYAQTATGPGVSAISSTQDDAMEIRDLALAPLTPLDASDLLAGQVALDAGALDRAIASLFDQLAELGDEVGNFFQNGYVMPVAAVLALAGVAGEAARRKLRRRAVTPLLAGGPDAGSWSWVPGTAS